MNQKQQSTFYKDALGNQKLRGRIMEKIENREALDVASLAGDILLASGAEIFRVEETIFRIAHAYGVESSDTFVLSSGIFLTAGSDRVGFNLRPTF